MKKNVVKKPCHFRLAQETIDQLKKLSVTFTARLGVPVSKTAVLEMAIRKLVETETQE
jgi:hypothetical protein